MRPEVNGRSRFNLHLNGKQTKLFIQLGHIPICTLLNRRTIKVKTKMILNQSTIKRIMRTFGPVMTWMLCLVIALQGKWWSKTDIFYTESRKSNKVVSFHTILFFKKGVTLQRIKQLRSNWVGRNLIKSSLVQYLKFHLFTDSRAKFLLRSKLGWKTKIAVRLDLTLSIN